MDNIFSANTITALEQLRKINQVQQAIHDTWEYLEQYLPLANTHGADFITDKHWDGFLPEESQDKLLSLTHHQLINLPHLNPNDDLSSTQKNDWLSKFLSGAQKCWLENTAAASVVLDARTSCTGSFGKGEDESKCVPETMSEKKSHEIQAATELILPLMKLCGARVIVDVGSGKGYLGSDLAHRHHLPVLGLDSSDTNTRGAKQRDKVLRKQWEKLIRRQERKKQAASKKNCECGPGQEIENSFSSHQNGKLESSTGSLPENLATGHGDCCKDSHNFLGELWCEKSGNLHLRVSESLNLHGFQSLNGGQHVKKNQNYNEVSLDCSQLMHTPKTSLQQTSKLNHLQASSVNSQDKLSWPSSYVPVTRLVQPDMNLHQVLQEHAAELGLQDLSGSDVLLTGLHTCGSLAVTMMRLFLTNPGVVGLCVVGCCYQLMEESTGNSHSSQASSSQDHFPLSQYGKQLKLHLGRNARNLASQSVTRNQSSGQLQGADMLWRAMLSVVLHEAGVMVTQKIEGMRGLQKRSKSFLEYVQRAMVKLNLSLDFVTSEVVAAVEARHANVRDKMAAFFQLKLVLAPVIENLILLDRYLFLLEQETVDQASIVKLFDSVTSPRCFAIIATKKEEVKH